MIYELHKQRKNETSSKTLEEKMEHADANRKDWKEWERYVPREGILPPLRFPIGHKK